MKNNWYKLAQNERYVFAFEKQSGLKEMFPRAVLMALFAIKGGLSLYDAAEMYHVSPNDVESAMEIYQKYPSHTQYSFDDSDNNPYKKQFPPKSPSKTPVENKKVNINFATLNQDLLSEFKEMEGTKNYQKAKGYFRNNKFYPYRDSKGFLTIGYGHLIQDGEDFKDGITEEKAEQMLKIDAQHAVDEANRLLKGIPVTQEAAQIIANMIFQMGTSNVLKFKNMWSALKVQDYEKAGNEMLDSDWNKQTPTRAQKLSDRMKNQK